MKHKLLVSFLVLLLSVPFEVMAQEYKAPVREYKAVAFGIKADGVTLNTASIQRAIDFLSVKGGGTLTFYVGRYLTGSFELKSNVRIRLSGGAVFVFSPNAFDVQGKGGNAMIYADGQQNISVFGGGTIEGNSSQLCDNIRKQAEAGHIEDAEAFTPVLISFSNCSNATVSTLYLQNAPASTVRLNRCKDVTLKKLFVFNKGNARPAIDIKDCRNVKLQDTYVDAPEPLRHDGSSNEISISNCKTVSGQTLK